ncbi:MAG: ZIP family metal transporter [Paenisporosarcina sp.]
MEIIGYLSTAFGLIIGGVIAWFFNKLQKDPYAVYSICAGLILGLLSFEIVPEGIRLGGWLIFFYGFFSGILVFELILSTTHNRENEKQILKNTGIILAISISIHNLPIGFVLGSNHNGILTLSLLKTIFLHNIPEGMILFTPFVIQLIKPLKCLFLSFLVALPVGIGVYLGGLLGDVNPSFLSFMISFLVGTLYMVTIKEVLVHSIKETSPVYSILFSLLGFGCIAIYFVVI